MAAGRSKGTFLGVRYRRLAGRIGKTKAIVATEHTIWTMAHTGAFYDDLGADYYARRPDRTKKRAIADLEAMGWQVTLTAAS